MIKQGAPSEPQRTADHLLNNLVTELQSLTTFLKPLSGKASETIADLVSRILLATGDDLISMLREMLTHLLRIVEFKGVSGLLLVVLGKSISLVKTMCREQQHRKHQQNSEKTHKDLTIIVKQIVDVILVLNSRNIETEMRLRIIQTTYSLIEAVLLSQADYHLSTRIYSICFSCCLSTPTILSISASAVYSLTQIIFTQYRSQELVRILIDLLQLLLKNKKCLWASQLELKSIIWDALLIAVKHIPKKQWDSLNRHKELIQLLNQMYQISAQNSFSKGSPLIKHDVFRNCIKLQAQRLALNPQRNLLHLVDYTKYYKAFIYLSIYLSLNLETEIVPFTQKVIIFQQLYDHTRSLRFYIILEGISLLIGQASTLILQEEGMMLVDVFQKVCQQLYASKMPFHMVWENNELLMEKIFADYSKITDQDYLGLSKNMLIRLRKSFQKQQTRPKQGRRYSFDESMDMSLASQLDPKQNSQKNVAYRWRRLIKSVIRIIRYLTSLHFKQSSNDQAIRRFMMQLQYWFMICPNHKTRNMILLELQYNTANIQNQNQAIKASQCMQICSNILYGFYPLLNSVAVSIVVRILVNIQVNFESGKDYNELDEVCQMADRFYIEQRIITNEEQFKVTIQGFIQCINLIVADMQLPQNNEDKAKEVKDRSQKYLKLIEHVLYKFKFVLEQNQEYIQKYWNFIMCFWVTMCSNKHYALRIKVLKHLEQVFVNFLKNNKINQIQIINTYIQLSRIDIESVSRQIIQHLKLFLLYFKEEGLVLMLQIIKEMSSKKYNNMSFRDQLSELEEIFVKEALFKITSQKSILDLIEALSFQGKSKNQQYKTVSFLWNIADHLKALYNEQPQQTIWKNLLTKIIKFAKESDHPGTRQSCIHTFTQIIADCQQVMGEKLFYSFLAQEYAQLFGFLMGFDDTVPKLQATAQIEIEKMVIKNYIKITKKYIYKDSESIASLFSASCKQLSEYLTKEANSISIEYLFELCQLLEYFKEIVLEEKEREQSLNIVDTKKVFQVLQNMKKLHEKFDKSTYFWKKKYEPSFVQLEQFFQNKQ